MKLRPIGHEDRLSIIDHLDELRTRIIVCGVVLFVAFGACFWQNHALLELLNRPLPAAAKTGLGNQPRVNHGISDLFKSVASDLPELAPYMRPGAAPVLKKISRDLLKTGDKIHADVTAQEKPLALGVGEAFTITIVVCGYFALLITLPVILYQFYAFVIPGLSRQERKVATPVVIAAPVLFLAGAAFTYFAVLPPAIHFLQGYNSQEFQNLVQAKSVYKFELFLMMGIGLAFQIPLLALGLQRVGVLSSKTLTLNWRYATVLIAVIVATLPGVDPVTMTMEMLPLVGIYIASIGLLKWVEHRDYRRARTAAATSGDAAGDAAGDSGTS